MHEKKSLFGSHRGVMLACDMTFINREVTLFQELITFCVCARTAGPLLWPTALIGAVI